MSDQAAWRLGDAASELTAAGGSGRVPVAEPGGGVTDAPEQGVAPAPAERLPSAPRGRAVEQLSRICLTVTVCIAVPAALIVAFGSAEHEHYVLHFVAVGATTVVALTASLALTVLGTRRGDGRAVLVGTAFSAMAALLLIHGLATPEILVSEQHDGLIAFAGGTTLPTGAAVLALASAKALRRPDIVRRLLLIQALLLGGILVVGVVGLAAPSLVPAQPAPNSPPAIALLVFSIAVFARLAERSRRTLVLTRRLGDLWVLVGVLWLAIAVMCSLLMPAWSMAWWLGHVIETLGIAAVGIPVALDMRRGRTQSRPLSGDLNGADLVANEEALLGPHVRALTQRLGEKDHWIEQHTRRVALLAVLVGEELGLAPTLLRRLAIGGLLHDIGKLHVPDEILGKPAALSDEEFAMIRRHPGWGEQLAGQFGFERAVRVLIRSHHERLDGRGYPDGLSAPEMSIEVRVMTVCDVYDALTDERVYRSAIPCHEALEIIEHDTPAGFDEGCLAALRRVLDHRRHD